MKAVFERKGHKSEHFKQLSFFIVKTVGSPKEQELHEKGTNLWPIQARSQAKLGLSDTLLIRRPHQNLEKAVM